jgi:hypothetical protein
MPSLALRIRPKSIVLLSHPGFDQGKTITVVAESSEELKCLKAYLKQPKISNAPIVVQDMIGKKCIAIEMEREKGNKYVGRIDTSDLMPGDATVKLYPTDLDKEYSIHTVSIKIK